MSKSSRKASQEPHTDRYANLARASQATKPTSLSDPHLGISRHNFSILRPVAKTREDYLKSARRLVVANLGLIGIDATSNGEFVRTAILPWQTVVQASNAEDSGIKNIPQDELVRTIWGNLPASRSHEIRTGFRAVILENTSKQGKDNQAFLGIELVNDALTDEQDAVAKTFAEQYNTDIATAPLRIGLVTVQSYLAEDALRHFQNITAEHLPGVALSRAEIAYPKNA